MSNVSNQLGKNNLAERSHLNLKYRILLRCSQINYYGTDKKLLLKKSSYGLAENPKNSLFLRAECEDLKSYNYQNRKSCRYLILLTIYLFLRTAVALDLVAISDTWSWRKTDNRVEGSRSGRVLNNASGTPSRQDVRSIHVLSCIRRTALWRRYVNKF